MDEAFVLKNKDCHRQAARAFADIAKLYPTYAAAFGMCGAILYCELNKPKDALPYCKKATKLAPKSKMASLSFFHSLWKLDRTDEAIAEMQRYLRIGYLEDYVKIAEEMYYKWVLDKDPPPWKKRHVPKAEVKATATALEQLRLVSTLTEA